MGFVARVTHKQGQDRLAGEDLRKGCEGQSDAERVALSTFELHAWREVSVRGCAGAVLLGRPAEGREPQGNERKRCQLHRSSLQVY